MVASATQINTVRLLQPGSRRTGWYEQIFPWTGFGCFLRRYSFQHRFPDYRFPHGYRSGTFHRSIEYWFPIANHWFPSHHLLAILKAADTGQNFWIIIACALAVFAIVQIIQDTFLVPKIMGKITGLNPAIILLSLSIWGSLMGMLGMIIALPLTTLMLSYYQRFIINKERIKYDEVETTDNQEASDKEEK